MVLSSGHSHELFRQSAVVRTQKDSYSLVGIVTLLRATFAILSGYPRWHQFNWRMGICRLFEYYRLVGLQIECDAQSITRGVVLRLDPSERRGMPGTDQRKRRPALK